MGNFHRFISNAPNQYSRLCSASKTNFVKAALLALGGILAPELVFGQLYTFTNASSGVPNVVATNATGTALTRGAGLGNTPTCLGATDGFSADAWPTYNYGASNFLATPNSSGDYIEFTITPDPGYKLLVDSFTAQLRRDNPTGTANDGPTQTRYAYSTDGFATFTQNGATLAPGTSNVCTNLGTVRNWTTPPSSFHFYSTGAVTFRIYGFNSGANTTGDLHLRNVIVYGTVERISVNLSASALPSAADCGDIFDVTVQVDTGFQQLASTQYSLNWDADQFHFLSYSAAAIGGSDPVLDTMNNGNGELSYSWLGNCTTLPNGSDLLTVQFQVLGCSATDEPVNLTGNPLVLEASDCNASDIQVVAVNNALVDISPGLPVMLNCPGDQTQAAGQTQAAIDAAYRAWINAFGFSGGCFPEASFDIDTSLMPSACGDTIVANYTVTSNCNADSVCTDTFIVVSVPLAGIIQYAGNPFDDVCVGDTAVFRAAVPNAGAPAIPVQTYTWTLSGSPVVTPAGGLGADGITYRRQEAIYGAGDVGVQTVDLIVTYTNGCVETAVQHDITVHALPVMTCPANTSLCLDGDVVDLTTLSPSAAPAPGTFSGTGVSGNNFDPMMAGLGTHTITYVHTNTNGCTDSCSFTIIVEPVPSATIQYNTAPEGDCASGETVCSNEPTDISFTLSNGDELIVTEIWHEFASNDGNVCPPGASAGYGPVTGSAIQVGDDVAGGIIEGFVNDSTENVRITFVLEPRSSTGALCAGAADTVNIVIEPMPQLVNCPGDTILQTDEIPGDCVGNYIWDHPTVTGGCPTVTLEMQIDNEAPETVVPGNPTDGEFTKGVHTVTYTATDSQGNEDTCSFSVTVQDNEAPTITCPTGSPFARNTDTDQCNYTVLGAEFNATFVENCPGATLTNSFNNTNTLAGADLPKGSTTITWTITDGMGMSSTNCVIVVNVSDNQPPTVTCPTGSPFARNTDANQCNYTVQGAEFNASFGDNCPGATLTNSFNNTNTLANADLPKGPTTITWTVTDGMGMSSATCAITVNVTDNQAPTITCAFPSPFARNTDMGECNYTVQGVEFDPIVSGDNCPGSTISNNFNSMNTLAGADLPKGPTTITWTVTDGMGMSSATCAITVNVTDNQMPMITCAFVSPFARNTDGGQCNYTVLGIEFDPVFSDNCPNATITNNFNSMNTLSGADLPKGSTTIIWTVTDGMGMSSTTCSIVVNVTDNQAPTITCPAGSPFARNTDTDQCNYTVLGAEFNPTFGDNCPGSTITNSFNNTNTLAGADLPKGSTTITWTVTDGMGMSSTNCAIVVNVSDNQPPTVTCPTGSPFARNTDANQCNYTVLGAEFNATFGDNCPGSVITNSLNNTNSLAGVDLPKGPTTITWTVIDGMGMSSATCAITVNVTDNQAPTITCAFPSPFARNTDMGECNYTVQGVEFDPVVHGDNCPGATILNNFNNMNTLSGADLPSGPNTIVWTVTDGMGMSSATCAITVNVTDSQPPVITCPAAITVQCGNTDTLFTGVPTVANDCNVTFTFANSDTTGAYPCTYTFTRTFKATDLSNNTATCTQLISVRDTQAPTFTTCPGNTTVECGASTAPAATGQPAIMDICDPSPVLSVPSDVTTETPGPCDERVIMRTWYAVDHCFNSTACVQTITVDDTTPPSLTCPASLTIECGTDTIPGLTAPTGQATATDNCGPVTVTHSSFHLPVMNNCPDVRLIFRTWTATDACGNVNTCSVQNIIIRDTQAPTLTNPASNLTVECDGAGNMAALNAWLAGNGGATASDVCAAVVWSNNFTALSDGCGASGSTTVTFTATDACAHTTASVATFTVLDTAVPTITCPSADLVLECDGNYASEIAAWVATASATDVCDAAPAVSTDWNGMDVPALNCGLTSGLTIKFTATDACGKTATCSRMVYVDDTVVPTITCPVADLTLECDGNYISEIAAWVATATASDACDATPTITDNWNDVDVPALSCTLASGLTIQFTATDDCNNTASCSRTVFIDDTAVPTITCPVANLTLECDGNYISEIAVWIATATASDACDATPTITDNWNDVDVPALSCNLASGLTIQFTATDDCNNAASCSRTVFIDDTAVPTITCPSANLVLECDGNYISEIAAWVATATASDVCDATPTITDNWNDVDVPALSCNLSAGLTIQFTATDDCNNTAICSRTVFIDDTVVPGITCPADTVINCEISSLPAVTGTATASDNCDASPTVTFNDGTPVVNPNCADSVAFTRTWLAVDDCGNQSSCNQRITKQDTTDPVIVCPGNVLVSCENPHTPAQTGSATASDNCDAGLIIFHTDVATVGNCPQDSTISRRWIAVDNCGNLAICIQTITVRDLTAPVLTCAMPMTIACDADTSATAIGFPTVTDNCDAAPTVFHTNTITPSGLCTQTYTITRVWTAVDDCNNSNTCSQTINVQDILPPVLVCAPNVTVECSDNLTPGMNNPTGIAMAADNCDLFPTVLLDDEIIISGSCPQQDTIRRTWVAIDDCANPTACVQTIVLLDRTRPIWTTPAGSLDRTVECSDATGISAAQSLFPTASDNCDNDVTNIVENAGTFAPGTQCPQKGTYTNTWMVTDDCGNTSTVFTQVITISDTTRPVVIAPNSIDIECSTALPAAAVTITEFLALPGASASDNCTMTPDLSLSSSTSALTGTQCTGSFVRTYTITDQCGNSTSVTQTVTVTDNTAPAITCPVDTVINCEVSQFPANTGMATATDNCDAAPVVTASDNPPLPGGCPNNYTIVRIWTAMDACLNSTNCMQTITVQDTTRPVLTCPADVTLNCDDPQVPSIAGDATVTDNCDPAPVVSHSDAAPIPGACANAQSIARTWMAVDVCGNQAITCVQTITVQDTTKPVITCPAGTTVNCENTTPAIAGTATATDNCDASPVVTSSDMSTQTNTGACTDQTYTIKRIWKATDVCNNMATCEQIIFVQDTSRPAILCPLNITINCEVDTIPVNTGQPIVQDNCDVTPGITHLDIVTPGNCPDRFVIRRRWIAVDNCANINACEHFITVQDTTKPVLTLPANVTLNCNDILSPAGQAGMATATDNCSANPTVTHLDNPVTGLCAHSYTIQRTWTATDDCGNSTSAVQTIIVRDVTAPVIQCPADQTIECNASTDPNVNTALGKAIAIDNCDPLAVVTYIDAKSQFGPCIRDTIITRTWGALDNCNNASACQQTITKIDTQAPVLTCPADTVINCNTSMLPAALGTATATDNCGVATMPTFSDAAPVIGQCPQQQIIIRTWSSTDDCGHTGTCSQRIAVQDTTRPVVIAPNAIDIECSTALPAAATTIAGYNALAGASASDNCTPTANLTVGSSTSAFTGTQCSGNIIRTYTITDQCGNSTSVTQTITVTDNTVPAITCPADTVINCEVSQLPANIGIATATDNCDAAPVVTASDNPPLPGGCPNNYTIVRIWTAVDACQNSTNCMQTIMVQDTTRPVLTCPADVVVNCDASTLPANTGTATAADNCAPAPTVSHSDAPPVPGACANAQTIFRTWMAVDACGNSAITCVQTITVQDTTKPVITCPANATVNCDNTTPAVAGTATATDNCSTPTINFTENSTPGNCPDARTIARTWKATDACNNMATCVQTIVVQDTTKPVIICPLDRTINCETDPIPANTGTAIASDNCDLSVSVTHLDTPVSGNCPQERVISRRWIAVDNCQNGVACIQLITVQDTTRPAITCPINVSVECDDDLTPTGTGNPTVLDNCDTAPFVTATDVSTKTANGTCTDFSYTITRTWKATDACGNTNTCEQTIIVDDTTPPLIACPNPISVECDKDLAPGSNATGTAIAIDNCDTGADVVFVNDVDTPSGLCPQEYKIERTWAAVDACGNVTACVQTIFVVDDTPPVINCVAALTVECGSDTSAAAIGIPGVTDNCGTASSPTHSNTVQAGNCPQEYVITRTWTSVDDCGNAGTCVQTITVDDSMAPTITCPAGLTVQCDDSTDPMATGSATASDNCDLSPAITSLDISSQTNPDACTYYTYTIKRRWTATDACGNFNTCSQVIEVVDTEAPTIICPPNATVNCEVWPTAIPSMTGAPTTSDNCDPAPPVQLITQLGLPDVDCPQMITFTLTWFTSDYCGNTATCEQIVVAQDTTRPVIFCPADVTVECDESTLPTATGMASAQDNCDPAPVISSFDDPTSGNCPANYTIQRSWTATDACDNEAICIQTITVTDTTKPELLICPPATVTVECGMDESPMSTGVPTASDNCDPGVSYDSDDVVVTTGLQCPLVRRITRTWTITDDCGNSLTNVCLQTILVLDNTAPLIACPADITIACDVPTHPDSLMMHAIAIDACDPIPTVVWDDASTTAPCTNDTLSAITRTWFAFDVCGNVAVCDQVIALIDNMAPAITCPADTVINCEVNPVPTITGLPTVSDNCDAAPVITVLMDDSVQDPDCPQAKTINRTFQVADHCGNTNTCLQIITVQDTTRPVIICPANITIECDESTDPSNTGAALASDNCDSAPVITHTNLPATPLGGCPFNRRFTRVWLAGDACDNGSLCMQTITILDTEGPVVVCPNSVTLECGSDTSAIALGFATASDNCGSATTPVRSDVVTSGNCLQEYVIARTWTSVDDCGNVGTCVQTITVDDSTAPALVCPANLTIQCDEDTTPMATGSATASDNCGPVASIVHNDDITQHNCPQERTIARTWTATDACGNATTCVQTIEIIDDVPPTFDPGGMLAVTLTTELGAVCPADAGISLMVGQIIAFNEGWTVAGIPIQSLAGFISDNCAAESEIIIQVASIVVNNELLPCRRTITISFQFSDPCGNLTPMLFTCVYEIVDNTAPTFTVPADVTLSCEQNVDDLGLAGDVSNVFENCTPTWQATYSDNVDGLTGCNGTGVIARTWSVVDECSNFSEQTQIITIVDITAPTLVCPANATVNCDNTTPAAAGQATASDNCDATPTVNFGDQNTQTNLGLCSDQSYMIIRTWTAFDDCGNQAIACTQTIIVRDVTAPVITCPSDKTVSCEESLNPLVNIALGTASSVDNCDPDPGITSTDFPMLGNCPNERTILRTWLTVDNCNNAAACTQTIHVVDDTPPAITCPQDTVINCEIDPIVDITGVATATDLCDGNPTVTHSDDSTPGACPTLRTIARTWMAVDACGNSTICVQTITVQDTTRPLIICPANVTVQCNESTDPMNTGEPDLNDNCDQMLASNHIDNPLPPIGCTQIILRNWITADDCNNAAACSQLITITDSKPPTLTGVPDLTLQCGDVVPPVGSPTVTDNCDAMPTMSYIGQDSIPNQCPNSYALLRSWALGDACGNSTVFVQTITVQDTQAPVWTDVPADVTVECDAVPAIANPTATDVCDNDVTVMYNGQDRFSGECPDFYVLTRTWTAVDNCNNSTTYVQTITVQDTSEPTWESTLPGDITVECGQVPQPAVLTAEDNCDNDVEVAFGESSAEGACPIRMVITRTWVASDNCSNSTVHTQTITVTDTTPPAAVCQNITVELNQNGTATIAHDAVNNNSSDICGAVNFSTSQTIFDCSDLGANTVTLTVTDGCGLTATCTASVTVRDVIPPVWTSQPGTLDRTVECGDAGGLAAAQSLAPTATDNCGPVTPVKSAGDFIPSTSCPPVGTFTNTWTVMDASGNSASVFMQTITISDTTKPVLTCPANLTLECSDEDKDVQIADWLLSATATDNCSGTLVHDNDYDGDSIPPVSCDLSQGLTVHFTVSDNCGNTAACSASIHVLDTEGPTINGDCALLDQYGNGSNAATYIVGTSAGAACPNVATLNLALNQIISDTFQIKVGGITVPGILGCLTDNCTPAVNLTARVVAINQSGDNCRKVFDVRMVVLDVCNNQSADTLRYVLELIDNTAPTFSVPANITVYLDENCDADLSGTGDVTNEQDNCQTGLNATFTDVEVPIQGSVSEYILERTWTLTDGCGNTASAQIQLITVLDTIKPDFGCPSSIEVAPNSAGCTFVVDGTHLDPDDPTDNCGTIVASYDLSGATDSTGTGSLDGMAFNEGTTLVTWIVSDGNGNSVTCTFMVIVAQCIQISGTLIWEGDDSDMTGVAQAMVALSGDASDTDGLTLPDGKYTLIAPGGGNFVVTPTKTSPPANPLNGVSVLDALLVQQYIVGLHMFPDGYKMIAADVNMSNAITTLDASIIRQAILGSGGAMAYFLNKPWRFVPTKPNTPYSMGYDPGSNPFASLIPSTRVLTSVTADAIGEDFYGIKTGDVNATGNPQNKPENLDPLRLRVLDRTLEAGQNIYVPVRMAAFENLAGYQVAFDFDTDVLELISVEPISSPLGLTPASHFGLYKAAEGEIRSAWIDPYGQTIAEEMPVFALRFAVKQSGAKLSEVLGMKPKAISPEAYNMDHEVAGIELQFYEEQTTSTFDPTISDVPGMTLQQNRPNPFTDRTIIGFSLDLGCDAQLRILDVSGRELYRVNNYYPAGKHEEVIYLRDLRATGVLYYELRTPYGTLTRKMTALAP